MWPPRVVYHSEYSIVAISQALNKPMNLTEMFDHLDEGKNDEQNVMIARHIRKAFSTWLSRENDDVPLSKIKNVFPVTLNSNGRPYKAYAISAADAGLTIKRYSDLWFAVGYMPGNESLKLRGNMQAVHHGDDTYYYVCAMVSEDPADRDGVLYGIEWSSVLHEIVHYLDQKRGMAAADKKHIEKTGRGWKPKDYYNNPAEFNAHFQQGVDKILSSIVRSKHMGEDLGLESFEKFKKMYRVDFPKAFYFELKDEYKKKFYRRFYQLWAYLKDKEEKAASEETA